MSHLNEEYSRRFDDFLKPTADALERDLKNHLVDCKRIDRISARPKDIESFLKKAAKKDEKGSPKYSDPLNQIQDQIGARIIVFYKQDVEIISAKVHALYHAIEDALKIPENTKSFDYEGRHFILKLPKEIVSDGFDLTDIPNFFELQVKTLFQHAWAEANHDIVYKAPIPLTTEHERMCAYAAAQAWGADRIFKDLAGDVLKIG